MVAGVGSAASSLAWVEPARPYLVALTVAVLAWAWYRTRTAPLAAVGDCCAPVVTRSPWQGRKFLAVVTILSGLLMGFPYYAKFLYPVTAAPRPITSTGPIRVVEFKIAGMTCEACTDHVRHEVARLPGIERLDVSYPQGTAVIAFRSAQTTISQLTAAVNSTGYCVIQALPHDAATAH